MGQLGRDVAQVGIESAFWSKINWTQIVGWIATGLAILTSGKFDLSAEMQGIIVLLQGIAGLATIFFRNNSITITPKAAAKLGEN